MLPQQSSAQAKALCFLEAGRTLGFLLEAERAQQGEPWLKAKQSVLWWSDGTMCWLTSMGEASLQMSFRGHFQAGGTLAAQARESCLGLPSGNRVGAKGVWVGRGSEATGEALGTQCSLMENAAGPSLHALLQGLAVGKLSTAEGPSSSLGPFCLPDPHSLEVCS